MPWGGALTLKKEEGQCTMSSSWGLRQTEQWRLSGDVLKGSSAEYCSCWRHRDVWAGPKIISVVTWNGGRGVVTLANRKPKTRGYACAWVPACPPPPTPTKEPEPWHLPGIRRVQMKASKRMGVQCLTHWWRQKYSDFWKVKRYVSFTLN